MKKLLIPLAGVSFLWVQGQQHLMKPESADDQTIEEVVLTGFARNSFVKTDPLPIKKVSAQDLELVNTSNIVDALVSQTPGLVAVKTGPNISKPFIRGLGFNRVLTLYDNLRQEGQQWGEEHGLELDPYNIRQVEIIKGPSSLQFGSDAIAGVISFFSRMPNSPNSEFLTATGEYQSNNHLIGSGVNWGINRNHWQLAVAGSKRMAQNYRNKYDGRVYNTSFRDENFSAAAGYEKDGNYSQLHFTHYSDQQGIPDGSRNPLTGKFTKQVLEGDLDDPDTRPEVSTRELNSYKLAPLHQKIRHTRLYTNNRYQTACGEIRATLGYQKNERIELDHPTDLNRSGMHVILNTVNYNLSYSPNLNGKWTFTFGTNGMIQKNKNQEATDFPIPDYRLNDIGAFGLFTFRDQQFTITGGLRWDHRNLHWKSLYTLDDPETGFTVQVPNGSPGAEQQYHDTRLNFNGFTASLGTTYQVNSHLNLKFNVGRAYRAPNLTELASNGLDPGAHIIYLGDSGFKPEFSLQQDLSAIWTSASFSGELNLYNNNLTDYIYLQMETNADGGPLTDAQGNRTYKYHQSKAQLYGLDFYASIHPKKLRGWTLDNSIAFVRGFNRSHQFKGKGIEGEYLPLIPPLQWRTHLEKKINLRKKSWKSIRPFIESEYSARQTRYLGLNQTERATPSFFLFNLGISSKWELQGSQKRHSLVANFQVNNLLDKAYQDPLSRLKYFDSRESDDTTRFGIYNMGRNFTFKLSFNL